GAGETLRESDETFLHHWRAGTAKAQKETKARKSLPRKREGNERKKGTGEAASHPADGCPPLPAGFRVLRSLRAFAAETFALSLLFALSRFLRAGLRATATPTGA